MPSRWPPKIMFRKVLRADTNRCEWPCPLPPQQWKGGSFSLQGLWALFPSPHTELRQKHSRPSLLSPVHSWNSPPWSQTPLTPPMSPVLQLCTFKLPSTNSLGKRNSFAFLSPCCVSFLATEKKKQKKPKSKHVESCGLLSLQETQELRRKTFN